MILQNKTDWQQALGRVISCPAELASRLQLPEGCLSHLSATGAFPLKVPETMLGRMELGNPDDPVLKQFLPSEQELVEVTGFVNDPLEESKANLMPGLLQKFDNRVLLTLSHHCAVHCRYCFRRNFNYSDNAPGKAGWARVYEHIAANTALEEVILSGGDPLSLPDPYLAWHLAQIALIPQIRVIRFHTRFPVVIPARITDSFIQTLKQCPLPLVIVLHCNHANEINQEVKAACALLKNAGVTLLNQAVCLRGVNDSVEAQRQLAWALFDSGVQPYYLHAFDPVKGAHHFDLPLETVKNLYLALRKTLPGYLVPQLVKEVPGEKAKVIL